MVEFAEYIMRNTVLEEAQAGIKIAGTNINNLRYADDTTLMAESERELHLTLSVNFGLYMEAMEIKIEQASLVQGNQTRLTHT